MSISRSFDSPSTAIFGRRLPAAASVWKVLSLGMLSLARAAHRRMAEWQAIRRVESYGDAFLKDVGVPRCGIEEAVRYRGGHHTKR